MNTSFSTSRSLEMERKASRLMQLTSEGPAYSVSIHQSSPRCRTFGSPLLKTVRQRALSPTSPLTVRLPRHRESLPRFEAAVQYYQKLRAAIDFYRKFRVHFH